MNRIINRAREKEESSLHDVRWLKSRCTYPVLLNFAKFNWREENGQDARAEMQGIRDGLVLGMRIHDDDESQNVDAPGRGK